jgi:hypothetical protein
VPECDHIVGNHIFALLSPEGNVEVLPDERDAREDGILLCLSKRSDGDFHLLRFDKRHNELTLPSGAAEWLVWCGVK